MLDRKKVLGSKIKKLREEKKLSRGELCGGEEELTVRQLARIEAGESLPTLPKIEYIAEQLSVSVASLVDRKYVELPKRYLQLKHELFRLATYNDQKRLTLREECFNEIYENYYDELPEEEQMSIDVQRAIMDVHLTENTDFGVGILKDYFSQILQKKWFTVNDLLVVDLYFHCIHFKGYDEDEYIQLFNKIVEQVDSAIDIELLVLHSVIFTGISVFMEFDNYDKLIDAVKVSNAIMHKNQDFQKKPVIDMIEGKYWLFSQRDIELAKQKYLDGAQCAKLFGDEVLSEKIMAEWNLDLQEFQRRR